MKVRVYGTLLVAALAASLTAQDSLKPDGSYIPTYRMLPDTPLGEPNGEDPEARIEWMRERFAGDLGADFTQLVLQEVMKDQSANPGAFRWNGAHSQRQTLLLLLVYAVVGTSLFSELIFVLARYFICTTYHLYVWNFRNLCIIYFLHTGIIPL